MSFNEKMDNQDYIELKSQEFINSCSWFLMRKVVRQLTNQLNAFLKETGILSTQLGALAILAIDKELNISEIAQILDMDQTTATRNIRQLEKENLISLVEDEDKRVKRVTLTDLGRDRLRQALPIWEQNQKRINELLGIDRVQTLDEILKEILQMLHQKKSRTSKEKGTV